MTCKFNISVELPTSKSIRNTCRIAIVQLIKKWIGGKTLVAVVPEMQIDKNYEMAEQFLSTCFCNTECVDLLEHPHKASISSLSSLFYWRISESAEREYNAPSIAGIVSKNRRFGTYDIEAYQTSSRCLNRQRIGAVYRRTTPGSEPKERVFGGAAYSSEGQISVNKRFCYI